MFKHLLVTGEELLKGFLACLFMETVVIDPAFPGNFPNQSTR